jgi:DNA modification methylase
MKYIERFIETDIDMILMNQITEINELFKETELYLTEEENGVRLYFHTVDMKKLEDYVNHAIPKEFPKRVYEEIDSLKSYGIKSGKRVYVGYADDKKAKDKKTKKKKRQEFFYVDNSKFSKKNNELSPDQVNQIICGDSEDYLKTLPDNSIDLILTSPPYNFGIDYNEHDDASYWKNYFEKMDNIIKECVRVLKWGGRMVFNIQPLFSDYIPSHHIFSQIFMNHNLIWKGEILWEKNNYSAKFTSWGSWLSPSSPYLKYTHEFIEVYCKGDLKKEGNKEKADLTPEEFKTWTIGKWSIAPERNMKKYGHPAMFPEELAKRAIKLFSFQDDVVLDPFNGAGTTTYVAKTLNRKFIGVDISEEYCEIARKRLNHEL